MAKKQRSYSEQERRDALHRLALEAGNSVRASQALGIPEQTLRQWRNLDHREDYERIREELGTRLDRELAEDMAALAKQRLGLLAEVGNELSRNLNTTNDFLIGVDDEDKAMQRLERELSSLASADKNLATSLGILTQNNRVLRDKPSEITERRSDWGTMTAALEKLGVIDAEHEEITDAQVVDPPALEQSSDC